MADASCYMFSRLYVGSPQLRAHVYRTSEGTVKFVTSVAWSVDTFRLFLHYSRAIPDCASAFWVAMLGEPNMEFILLPAATDPPDENLSRVPQH